MVSNINHIGLQVIESDVNDFYRAIFNFKLVRTFILTKENAFSLFGMPMETTVLVGECPEMELELFIQERKMKGSFNHICFNTYRIAELTEKAMQKGYKCMERQPSGTVFISDSNQNVFEIKSSLNSENHD